MHNTQFRKLNNAGENFLTESRVYKLIFKSKKEEAERFQDWIADEVMPSIRKTGSYIVDNDNAKSNAVSKVLETANKDVLDMIVTMAIRQKELLLENEKLIEDNKKKTLEIEHKEDVIIGLVDTISVAEKRQILNRVVRYKNANYQERWNLLYDEFQSKYHLNIKTRMKNYNENNKPKIKSKIDYIDKVLNKIPELYEMSCKLFENDVKSLVQEIYDVM